MNDKEFYKILNILEDRYGDISKFEFFENEIVFGYEKDNCNFEIRFDTELKDICAVCFRNDDKNRTERPVYLDEDDLKTFLKCLKIWKWETEIKSLSTNEIEGIESLSTEIIERIERFLDCKFIKETDNIYSFELNNGLDTIINIDTRFQSIDFVKSKDIDEPINLNLDELKRLAIVCEHVLGWW